MLGTLYVWHGKGSLRAERAAALNHAQQIKVDSQVVEVRQGKEDETFWMVNIRVAVRIIGLLLMLQMLGEDFSSADYWRHRDEKHPCDPRFFDIVSKEDGSINVRG